ncbi:hypothetical protein [Pelomonas sp. KK5]|uniref:hypothetical protein n=1 Tax=Pelomonas sp. KK5 TaxID=1855730 RepID=UPI0018E9217B|nr:hypothetical protein [Pelomonas sp. KK5]
MSRFIAPRPLTLQTLKPRNPLVAASRMRQAGRHAGGNTRQQARRELQRAIAETSERSP